MIPVNFPWRRGLSGSRCSRPRSAAAVRAFRGNPIRPVRDDHTAARWAGEPNTELAGDRGPPATTTSASSHRAALTASRPPIATAFHASPARIDRPSPPRGAFARRHVAPHSEATICPSLKRVSNPEIPLAKEERLGSFKCKRVPNDMRTPLMTSRENSTATSASGGARYRVAHVSHRRTRTKGP